MKKRNLFCCINFLPLLSPRALIGMQRVCKAAKSLEEALIVNARRPYSRFMAQNNCTELRMRGYVRPNPVQAYSKKQYHTKSPKTVVACVYLFIIGSSGSILAMESDQSIVKDVSLEYENTEECFQKKIMACSDSNFSTPLHWAARYGDIPFLKELLRRNTASIDDNTNDDFWTPLHYAVAYGNVEAVRLLLSNGANPNPLIDSMAAMLIGYNTPIELAERYEYVEILDLLLTARDGGTPLHRAVRNGNRAETELLLENTESMLARDNMNRVPFEVAIEMGNIEIAELFIERGVDFKACTYRESPLHNARWTGLTPMIELILNHCPKPLLTEFLTVGDYKPLHIAARRGLLQIAILLIQSDAEVNAETNYGRTALDCAIYWKHKAMVDYLVRVGARGNYLGQEDLKRHFHTADNTYY